MTMLKKLLQGLVIGIANIIPGVSGGTMMVAMGIYDKLIHAITHLRKEFKESVRFMFPIFVGIAVAIIVAARILEFCFAMFPIQTNLLFCGLIAGSVPFIFTHVKGKAVKPGMIAAFLVFFLIVIAMALMGETEGAAADVSFSLLNVIKLLAVGIIAAATMVVPGVSGSMMLMVLGYYNTILESINDFVEAALSLDMPVLIENLLILVPFGIGVVIGIFLIAKIIEFIFQRAETHAYWAILGLILASPVAILLKTDWSSFSVVAIVTGTVTFAIGWFIASKLGDE